MQVIRRRKWIILQASLLLPLGAVLVSLQQRPIYQASAEVLLSDKNLAASLTNIQDSSGVFQTPERIADTQARLARVPELARRTLARAGVSGTADDFLGASAVSADPSADILEFRVTDSKRELAIRLATAYASAYTSYRRQLDTASLTAAGKDLESQLAQLRASGASRSGLYATLVAKRQQLRTLEALQTSNAVVVRPAESAGQVSPRPVRNGALGFGLGIILGIGLAFLLEALDTRLRSAEEIGERLHLPMLARLPKPPRRFRNKNRLVAQYDPHGFASDAYRTLRANLKFANLDTGARTIMITSAIEREGKSTTVANLGVVLARSGERVMMVDLDLRRPLLHKFFNLEGHPGLTDVALGHVTLEEAVAQIAIAEPEERALAGTNGRGTRGFEAKLEVLTSGPVPPDAGEFVGTRALSEILDQLHHRADIVLIDSPPLLRVSDPVTLSAKVDALLVVTSLKLLRRPMLTELARVLRNCPAAKLGFVVAGAEAKEGYGYGNYYQDRSQIPSEHQPVR